MPHHIIDVHVLTHTCPSNPQPHTVDTWRSLVDTLPGEPCIDLREVTSGMVTRLVDCRHLAPPDQQCPACQTTITTRTVTTTHLGEEATSPARIADGLLPYPCPVCYLPVATMFADTGRHLLCDPDGDQ